MSVGSFADLRAWLILARLSYESMDSTDWLEADWSWIAEGHWAGDLNLSYAYFTIFQWASIGHVLKVMAEIQQQN